MILASFAQNGLLLARREGKERETVSMWRQRLSRESGRIKCVTWSYLERLACRCPVRRVTADVLPSKSCYMIICRRYASVSWLRNRVSDCRRRDSQGKQLVRRGGGKQVACCPCLVNDSLADKKTSRKREIIQKKRSDFMNARVQEGRISRSD